MSKPFDCNDSADLPAFLAGLRRYIDMHHPVAGQPADDPAPGLLASLEDIGGPIGAPIRQMIDFMGQLVGDGLFDLAAHSANVPAKALRVALQITDFQEEDQDFPFVGLIRLGSGKTWYGFEKCDLNSNAPRVLQIVQKKRRGVVETSLATQTQPTILPLFLWHQFASLHAAPAVQFSDAPAVGFADLEALRDRFPTALYWQDAGALLANENSFLMAFRSGLGWIVQVTIPDSRQPHKLTPEILTRVDMSPRMVEAEVQRARKAGRE